MSGTGPVEHGTADAPGILAILNLVATAPSVLAVSGLLAARLGGARIEVLHVRPDVDPDFMPTEEVMTESRRREFQTAEDKRSSDLKEIWAIWQRQVGPGVVAGWREIMGLTRAVVEAEGRKAGFIVVGRGGRAHDASARDAVHAALFAARSPVVIVPEAVPLVLGQHVAVAWKPSEAADKAVHAALPILLAAKRVSVLLAAEEGGAEAMPRELTEKLGDRELKFHRFAPGLGGVGDALVNEAMGSGADLLVMGAYTHNRLIESLMGGATRDVLARADLPVLMHY